MIRRLTILAATGAALAVSAAPALADAYLGEFNAGATSVTEDPHAVVILIGANDYGLKQAVANQTEGNDRLVTGRGVTADAGTGNDNITTGKGADLIQGGDTLVWNNGDGNDHASFSIDIGTSENAKQSGRLEWPVLDYVRTPVR